MTLPNELVEDRNAATGSEYPRGLADRLHRVGHHGDDQVKDNRVEIAIREIQSMCVHHSRIHIAAEAGSASANPLHHCRSEIRGDDFDATRDEVEIRPPCLRRR